MIRSLFMGLLLATGLANASPHSGLSGTWVNVQGPGSKAKDVLHLGPGTTFTAKIQKAGAAVVVVGGSYKLVPPDASLKKVHVSKVVVLMIGADAGAKLGMPIAEQRAIRRRKDHMAVMTRFFYIPELPALTDMDKALFVRKGSEASVGKRYALMRKRLHF
jgi:hypothetical protein